MYSEAKPARPLARIAARVIALPASGLAAITNAGGSITNAVSIAMKVLVVAPSWIGDSIMMQPLLTLLKRHETNINITVLAPDWSAPLLARMPEVDAVIGNPFAHGELNLSARRALGRRISSTNWQKVYVLPNSWKSALVPYFAGIPERIGYHGEARFFLLNQRHRYDEKALPRLVDRYAALAGYGATEPTPHPRLRSSTEQQTATRVALGLPSSMQSIVFCPGAEFGPAKRWPARHFAELAKRFCAQEAASEITGNREILLLGSSKDIPVADEIVQLSGGLCTNLCGRTTLEQAIDLIAASSLVVSNDSGLMHVAAALDKPLLALYGSSSPDYTPPLSPTAKILSRQLACSPCFKRECPLGHFDCLNGLLPAEVETAAHAIVTFSVTSH